MSSVVIAGDTSGTVTLDAPAVAGSTVLTLPATSGTVITNTAGTVTQTMIASGVAGTGPAFGAFLSSNQTVSANTFVKVPFNTEEWDTASCYDNATNYRFTPTVAGYYQFSALIGFGNGPTRAFLSLYKNGADYKRGNDIGSTTNGLNLTAISYANGSTDYFEIYMFTNNGSGANLLGGQAICYFQASMVRGA